MYHSSFMIHFCFDLKSYSISGCVVSFKQLKFNVRAKVCFKLLPVGLMQATLCTILMLNNN